MNSFVEVIKYLNNYFLFVMLNFTSLIFDLLINSIKYVKVMQTICILYQESILFRLHNKIIDFPILANITHKLA